MVVAVETYQMTAPLTASGVATAVGDAFQDANLGGWYDSFLSGSIENRILEITYNGAKTYGKTYYWFQFTASGIYVQIANGWDATNHIPTGTQFADYYSTATNTTSNHLLLRSLDSNVTFSIKRWTSGDDANFSWFVMFNGTNITNFHLNKTAPISMYDLDKVSYHSLMWCQLYTAGQAASLRFRLFPLMNRRSFLGAFMRGIDSSTGGAAWYGASTSGEPWAGAQGNLRNILNGPSYHFPGNYNGSGDNISAEEAGIMLPYAFSNTNPSYATDSTPILYDGLLLNCYSSGRLPDDFGIAANYNSNIAAPLDVFRIVSGGVTQSRWEMLAVKASPQAPPGSASPMFLARIE